jgi:hypothetical protein
VPRRLICRSSFQPSWNWSSISRPRETLGITIPPMLLARTDEEIEYHDLLLHCIGPVMARPGSAWLREPLPLTGVKRTAMLRCDNVCF